MEYDVRLYDPNGRYYCKNDNPNKIKEYKYTDYYIDYCMDSWDILESSTEDLSNQYVKIFLTSFDVKVWDGVSFKGNRKKWEKVATFMIARSVKQKKPREVLQLVKSIYKYAHEVKIQYRE